MKKSIFTVLAVVAFASCSNDEVMNLNQEAITFDDAFVDNSIRSAYDGSYNTDKLGEFEVYGTITNPKEETANIFNQVKVSKTEFPNGTGDTWKYDASLTQYWIPGNTYKFWAIAEGNVTNVTEVVAESANKYAPTAINLLDASAQKDILLATENCTSIPADKTVSFIFNHVLSKAKFTVKNTITTNNGYSYKVSNIKVTTAKNGVYSIATGTWTAAATPATYPLSFGNALTNGTETGGAAEDIAYNESVESNYDRLLIPSTGTLTVQFDCELYKDGVLIQEEKEATNNARTATTQQAVTLEKGKAYNFIISLGNPGEKIKFTVDKVQGWDTTHNDYNQNI